MKSPCPKSAKKAPDLLGLPELIAIGVGGMIGGGIFSILGLAVEVSGHAAPLAFLIGSVIAAFAAYSYVRLALAYHSDGASFTYLERAYPRHLWIAGNAGWIVVIGYIGTLALYAFTFGAYASHLFGLEEYAWSRPALASASLLLFLAVNLKGTGTTGRMEDYAVYIKILLLGILAAIGFTTADPERLQPLFDQGVSSVFLGGALIFVAFEGFQLITNAVCESKRPERNIPRAIYGSIAITALLYVTIGYVAVSNLDSQALLEAKEYALAAVAKPVMGNFGVVMVDIAALLATASAINATLFGASRLTLEIARDGFAPKAFSFRNRSQVPAAAAWAIAILALLLTAFAPLELIASFSSLTFLLVSIAVSLANFRLRKTTNSARWPIVLGLALMSSTVCLLLIYMAQHSMPALVFSVCTYTVSGLSYSLYRWRRNPLGS